MTQARFAVTLPYIQTTGLQKSEPRQISHPGFRIPNPVSLAPDPEFHPSGAVFLGASEGLAGLEFLPLKIERNFLSTPPFFSAGC